MKTIEEMRLSVLVYCEEVCPNDDETFAVVISGLDCTITCRHHHGIADFDIRETGYFKRRIYQIRSSDEGDWWHLYYIFLGLEARDAVEALEKRLDTALSDLRKECDFSGRLTDENTKLESRNAALVEALDSARAAIEYDDDISTALILIKNALTANTEKGGVHG